MKSKVIVIIQFQNSDCGGGDNIKVLGVSGSPRKGWNTDSLINKILEGAASKGAETEIVYLYDLKYKGCISCFACKRVDGESYGKCAVKDDLAIVLRKVENADALILGSPIYFGEVTGEMRSFLERLFFQYLVYDKKRTVLTPKKMTTCFIYTMNIPESSLKQSGYEDNIKKYENMLDRFFGSSKSLVSTDTKQFDDYSKYVSTGINVEAKLKRREEIFPIECQNAYDFGVNMMTGIK